MASSWQAPKAPLWGVPLYFVKITSPRAQLLKLDPNSTDFIKMSVGPGWSLRGCLFKEL